MQAIPVTRIYKHPPVLVPGAPLTFSRALPALDEPGLTVEVSIHPDLTITVLELGSRLPILLGRYSLRAVDWDAAGDTSATSRAVLAADVHSLLQVFEQRLIDPRRWTTEPRALESLS